MKTLRPYRMVRVLLTVAWVLPHYLWLLLRGRCGAEASDESWRRAHSRAGRALYRLAAHLGGGFVKLAQIIGARGDVFPEPIVEQVKKLHDQVPSRPLATLRSHVEKELGRPLHQVYSEIDEHALAAASLAQVHRARLLDGTQVAVKIQYPDIRRIIPLDLKVLRVMAWLVSRLQSKVDLRGIAADVVEYVELEVDFSREAESTDRIRRAFAGDSTIIVPRVYPEASSDRLLTLSFVEGIPVSRLESLKERGDDLSKAAACIVEAYCQMLFHHGFFHGDPHPGNVLLLPNGSVAILDFGLARELSAEFRGSVAAMLAAALAGDAAGALQHASRLGFEVRGDDPAKLAGLLGLLAGSATSSGSEASPFELLAASGVERIPPDFGLVARALMLLGGLTQSLAPGEPTLALGLMKALASKGSTRAHDHAEGGATEPSSQLTFAYQPAAE